MLFISIMKFYIVSVSVITIRVATVRVFHVGRMKFLSLNIIRAIFYRIHLVLSMEKFECLQFVHSLGFFHISVSQGYLQMSIFEVEYGKNM